MMTGPKTFWITSLCLFVLVSAKPGDYEEEPCGFNCRGAEYECINGECYCAAGYIPNPYQSRCLRCPGLGEKCFGPCCNHYGNGTLTCWQGICQPCYDSNGAWVCRDSLDNIILISSTQIAMATALVLGIIATFVLLYKLCAATNLRPMGMGNSSNYENRLSIGSLQVYVDERLRDAPPRYSGAAAPPTSAVMPATVYFNAGFIHDSSTPPPPYTPQNKEENQQTAVHI